MFSCLRFCSLHSFVRRLEMKWIHKEWTDFEFLESHFPRACHVHYVFQKSVTVLVFLFSFFHVSEPKSSRTDCHIIPKKKDTRVGDIKPVASLQAKVSCTSILGSINSFLKIPCPDVYITSDVHVRAGYFKKRIDRPENASAGFFISLLFCLLWGENPIWPSRILGTLMDCCCLSNSKTC